MLEREQGGFFTFVGGGEGKMKVEDARPAKITAWAVEDRPREKLMIKGASSLSDAELLAILLGSGTVARSAVEVGRRLLITADNDLNALARFTVKELQRVKGVGEAKAIRIHAALEIGRRRKERVVDERPKIVSSRDAFEQISGELNDLNKEEFWVMFLNRAGRLIRKRRISEGGVSATHVDPRIIFKFAVEDLASSMIVAHNHPSGNLNASAQDVQLTKQLAEAGKLLEIRVIDHIIVAGWKYYSFADNGLL